MAYEKFLCVDRAPIDTLGDLLAEAREHRQAERCPIIRRDWDRTILGILRLRLAIGAQERREARYAHR